MRPIRPGDFDAVLFDFGGVFTPSPFEAVEAHGRAQGAPPGVMHEIVFGPYHEDTDHPWHRVERGEIPLQIARDEILALGRARGLESDFFQMLSGMSRAEGAFAPMVERAHALVAAGFRTALVTNNVKEFAAGWRKLVPADELFQVIVDSSAEGVRKPDPRIFELTLARLGGIAPERALFLDDAESNLVAAERLGIRGVLVEADPAGALASLDALLG